MDMNRRRFLLLSGSAAATFTVALTTRSQQPCATSWPFVITVQASGAWDPTFLVDPVADNAAFTPFTSWEGAEEGAEISPNGELVAFLSDREGEFDIWVSRIGSGFYQNLTRDIPPLASSGFIVRKLGFSADCSWLWF